MITQRSTVSLSERMHALAATVLHLFCRWRSRVHRATSLPDLLRRLGRRFTPLARHRHVLLTLDVDPALSSDLRGPFGELGLVLADLIQHALHRTRDGHVAVHVDVVGDEPGSQLLHFTVANFGDANHIPDVAPSPACTVGTCLSVAQTAARLAALGGTLHNEVDEYDRQRLIAEIDFALPPRRFEVDVDTLRTTLGGNLALQHVVDALDEALSHDIRSLDALFTDTGTTELQAWLHRVSGVLGMAEATELARLGLRLEQDLIHGRSTWLDHAIRRFADDARGVLDTLRAHVEAHRL